MRDTNLKDLSLDELIELARDRDLLEGWSRDNGHVHLSVGIIEVTLREPNAHAYLRGLIRGHDLAHSKNGRAQKHR